MSRAFWSAAFVWCFLGGAIPASALSLYCDTNGDGVATEADRLQSQGPTTVDVWLRTDPGESPAMRVFSYQFVLAAAGGTVRWGDYRNELPNMEVSFGRGESATELTAGYGGSTSPPLGRYKLGTLTVTPVSGAPRLEFRSQATVDPYALTAIGSTLPGKDDDHTWRVTGDGLGSAAAPTSRNTLPDAVRFSARLGPNPARGGILRLGVTTTRPGPVSVRLFDLQGRLVRTLLSNAWVGTGFRTFELGARGLGQGLASGSYLYRVESSEGVVSGRVTLLH